MSDKKKVESFGYLCDRGWFTQIGKKCRGMSKYTYFTQFTVVMGVTKFMRNPYKKGEDE